ncbi:hypothetical protein DFQ28_008267 [Apophysomyces sp. BC1034]|nr:hypothetical protein DFQ30_007973 [Apophysomyces sp. BC1015]KAG0175768.1 hypothetical protein DFQ29_007053 [Apophysomyces sp. BC1021]KAG0186138.1 hypothetical protein DFQ28_008267 [Apophysomyces sp. BC1034]
MHRSVKHSSSRIFCPLVLFHDDPSAYGWETQQRHYLIEQHREKTIDMLNENASFWATPHKEKSEEEEEEEEEEICMKNEDSADDQPQTIDMLPSTSTSSTSSSDSDSSITTIHTSSPTLTLLEPATRSSTPPPLFLKYDEPKAEPKRRRRGNLPKEVTEFLKNWLVQHKKHPYPTEKEKMDLAYRTGLTVNQISNWFINARRRILQPMLESENMVEQQQQLMVDQKRRQQLDIYAYHGFTESPQDNTRRWQFQRTKLPNIVL